MKSTHGKSKFSHHCECPKCGSSDAGSIYKREDGSAYLKCYRCDYFLPNVEAGTGQACSASIKQQQPMNQEFTIRSIPQRDITKETCSFYGVGTAEDGSISFPYGEGFKYRDPQKQFRTSTGFKESGLFGQDKFPKDGKYVTITEGEIDALSAYQMFGSKYACVSVKSGAKAAKKNCQEQFEWLDSFENIVICFDADEPGLEAAQEVAELFGAKAKIVKHRPGFKDANDYLMQQKQAEFVKAWWDAEAYKPAGIVSVSDIKERLLAPPTKGVPWCFPTLTKLTYGRRPGDIYMFGAGVGIGKTDVFTQSIAYDLDTLGLNVGVIYLEQPVTETVQRVVGKIAGKVYHVPDGDWSREEYIQQIERLEEKKNLYAFDHFGSKDWDTIKGKIRFMVLGLGCKSIYLDHLTALIANVEDERRALDALMADMSGLALELGVWIHVISHLTTPEGKAHEEGGRVLEKHFTGSRAIARWSHFMFGLERDKQHECPIQRQTTTFRVLKDRYTGRATGETFFLRYNHADGRLYETENMEQGESL